MRMRMREHCAVAVPQHIPEYAARRAQLLAALPDESIAIIPAGLLCYRNRDNAYPFRQHSDFYYLTGLAEPGHLLILSKQQNKQQHYICAPEYDAKRLQWEGPYLHHQDAATVLELDQAFTIKQAHTLLAEWCAQVRYIYLLDRSWQTVQLLIPEYVITNDVATNQAEVVDLAPLLHGLRSIKSPMELALMQQAADISVSAHHAVMQACRPGLFEYQLQAAFEYACRYAGAEAMAYNSIVAAGANACVLHYQQNQQMLRDGDLLLIDAGCEYQSYASDITRTYPVNGRFSASQAALYDLVLQAQQDALSLVTPGNRLQQVHQRAVITLAAGLLDLGILSGSLDEVLAKKLYQPYFMHGIGHALGLDVHDPGIRRNEHDVLQPGMVITVEPGIYIHADQHQVASHWRGKGIRIEDDILVTATGFRNLTAALPKTRKEIEALCAQT